MGESILDLPEERLTPGMKQYQDIKRQHPDCLIMLRMGDFYEMFYQDAETASRELEITLTARGQGDKRAPLAGVPFHALELYLGKLVKKGYKVAIVEQLEDPRKAKGLVKRGLVRIVTPGTVMEPALLEEKSNNYIAALSIQGEQCFVAACDLSTGEFITKKISSSSLATELARLLPRECLLPGSLLVSSELRQAVQAQGAFVQPYEDYFFSQEKAQEVLEQQFSPSVVANFNLEECLPVCGALVSYLAETQRNTLSHLQQIRKVQNQEFLQIDASTLRHLEILQNNQDGSARGTLLSVLDHTQTAGGGRLLKKWIQQPLAQKAAIEQRWQAIAELKEHPILREGLQELFRGIADIERLVGRINSGTATPRELVNLRQTLLLLPPIQEKARSAQSTLLQELVQIPLVSQLTAELQQALRDDPPLTIREGGIIKEGFSPKLDELLHLRRNSKVYLQQLEEQERQRTGISHLRIGYTQVFGYFLEVTKKNLHLIPSHYLRKQTTATTERYVTEELKNEEEKILHAQEQSEEIEYTLFQDLCRKVAAHTPVLQECATRIAAGDVLCSLAEAASKFNYVRPQLHDSSQIQIVQGRHPVVERFQNQFIPNDISLEPGEMMIITGPNMSGKSTLMRQTALILLLAQMGSFVPAKSMRFGLLDRIFSRVGASDDLRAGNSTFMVEMQETAAILQQATPQSFVILDEIGRGTSTFDGVSIAWSVAEYLVQHLRCTTLFATHYHVLNKLAEQFPQVKNFNVAVHDKDGEIILLHTLVPGGTDRSYGIPVAKRAGLPASVIARAQEIQELLEKEDEMAKKLKTQRKEKQRGLKEF